MPNDRFAPDFRVTINGTPPPAELRASITSVSFQSGLEGADRVEIALINENLRWLDHPLLRLDNRLTLEIGYAPDRLEQVFVGNIVSQSANFPNSGFPVLTVAAQDSRVRLQQGTQVRWFAVSVPLAGNFPISDPRIAATVSSEYAMLPILDPVGAAIAVLLGRSEVIAAVQADDPDEMQKIIRKQDGESDYDFLLRIAKENGWEMIVDHSGVLGGSKLRFFSPLDALTPDVSLKYGRSLADFTPRVSSVGQIVSVTAFVWVAQIKTGFTVTVGWDWDLLSLTIDIRPTFLPSETGPTDYRIKEPVTLVSAPRKVLSELIPRLNNRLTGSGSTVGDPRIRAGAVLQLDGLGEQFSGLYRVTSATHTIGGAGYQTSFDVRKEIWFSAIPLVAQGAAVIRSVTGQLTAAPFGI
jgi:phage protein D